MSLTADVIFHKAQASQPTSKSDGLGLGKHLGGRTLRERRFHIFFVCVVMTRLIRNGYKMLTLSSFSLGKALDSLFVRRRQAARAFRADVLDDAASSELTRWASVPKTHFILTVPNPAYGDRHCGV